MSRTATIARGVAALLLLAGLLVGVPLWLTTVSGSPIPEVLPSWDQIWTALTSRDDGTLLLGVLKYAAWAGWALFAASVLVDLIARLRGIPVPRLGPQQHLASSLVTAVAALAVVVPSGAVTASAPAVTTSVSAQTAAPAVAATDTRVPWAQALTAPAPAVEPTGDEHQQFTRYTVRRGDCLWDIAWNELGDPELWPELYEASRQLTQPDGRYLTDPDLIYPGWIVLIARTGHSSGDATDTQALGGDDQLQREPPRRDSDRDTPIRTPLSDATDSRTAPNVADRSAGGKGAPNPVVRSPLTTMADEPGHRSASPWMDGLVSTRRGRAPTRDWRHNLRPAP